MNLIFGGIEKFSTIDFPSTLSCVIFLKGCNLDCFYCHNRELLDEKSNTFLPKERVLDFLEKRKNVLEGVVVSGGEATMQKDTPVLFRKIKQMGYKTKLDTNGSNPQMLKALLDEKLVDYVAMDVKTTKEHYKQVCGIDLFENIALSYDILKDSNIHFELRTTLYPGMEIEELKSVLLSFPTAPLWRLNFFVFPATYKSEDIQRLSKKALTKEELENNKEYLDKICKNLVY